MRLMLKQRLFSWFDSYDICDENGESVFTVQGKLSWGHRLEISDANGRYLGRVQEEVFSFLPRFRLYLGEEETPAGEIRKELTFFRPRYTLDCRDWTVEGNWLEWDYTVSDSSRTIMEVHKEVFRLTDTYVLDILDDTQALLCVMIVLAIDAANCDNN